jgi:hypothetical protein
MSANRNKREKTAHRTCTQSNVIEVPEKFVAFMTHEATWQFKQNLSTRG